MVQASLLAHQEFCRTTGNRLKPMEGPLQTKPLSVEIGSISLEAISQPPAT